MYFIFFFYNFATFDPQNVFTDVYCVEQKIDSVIQYLFFQVVIGWNDFFIEVIQNKFLDESFQ